MQRACIFRARSFISRRRSNSVHVLLSTLSPACFVVPVIWIPSVSVLFDIGGTQTESFTKAHKEKPKGVKIDHHAGHHCRYSICSGNVSWRKWFTRPSGKHAYTRELKKSDLLYISHLSDVLTKTTTWRWPSMGRNMPLIKGQPLNQSALCVKMEEKHYVKYI
jgi:hypothetical protein